MSEQAKAADATTTPPKETQAQPKTEEAKLASPDNKQGEAIKPEAKVDNVELPKPPEKYELKTSKNSQLLKSDLEEIESAAKAKGLSQEDAQKLVESKEADFGKYFERQQQAYRDQQDQWRKEVESDREIAGADGKVFKENVELAHRGLSMFADDAFKKVLAESGLGNNPHMIRTFMRIGQRFADDKAVLDGKSLSPNKKVSREEKLFPTHFEKKKE